MYSGWLIELYHYTRNANRHMPLSCAFNREKAIKNMREAVATARIRMNAAARRAIRAKAVKKGDPLQTARLAGIMAAKRTAALIPLCHPLALTHLEISIDVSDSGARIEAVARTKAETGVEMEAMTAVCVAALTLYDMCKAVEKGISIGPVRLLEKSGGKSGHWQRQ